MTKTPMLEPKDQRVTIVLRNDQGLDGIAQYAKLGELVAIGRARAVIASVINGNAAYWVDTITVLDQYMRSLDLDPGCEEKLLDECIQAHGLVHDMQSPLHIAIALLEHAADKFPADKPWAADAYTKVADELRDILKVPKPATLGLAEFAVDRPGADARERGDELLLAVERAAREVVRRELTPGGLIARAIAGGVQ